MQPPWHSSLCTLRSYKVITKNCACSFVCSSRVRRDLRSFISKAMAVRMAASQGDYSRWTKESLLERVNTLEQELRRVEPNNLALVPPTGTQTLPKPGDEGSALPSSKRKQKKARQLDPSKYSTRFIALKLAYLGKNYNGFEYQSTATTPTIEEELWKALVKSCLIFPERPDQVDFSQWEYSKCGRTDRGVSAFGQVIGIRVRSNQPLNNKNEESVMVDAENGQSDDGGKPRWDPIADEIPYCRVLNRLLPPDIRMLAWCPDPPAGFSARFSCRERQYRYFFTQPAFAPSPSSIESAKTSGKMKDGWLDIKAMRDAAKKFEGLHDFRNFCKIDPGKQITNFVRRVFESDIVEVDDVQSALPFLKKQDFRPANGLPDAPYPKVYYFHVRGSAFLWHQIRHMVAVLFAVGQGLEPSSIVSDLLDVQKNPRRPNYNMADEVPLVLWDCIFPNLDDLRQNGIHDTENFEGNMDDSLNWIWLGEDCPANLHGSYGLVDHLWEQWREKKMDELLANRLLDLASSRANLDRKLLPGTARLTESQRTFEGGNAAKHVGKYVSVLKRPLLASPEEVNDKWAQSKGFLNAQEMTRTKNWRSTIKEAKNRADVALSSTEEV
ncbi:hypothetical protein VTK73DRAFT_4181 [Phialemonium thermophilum]|uniref:Pseudouridine synthase I TruA alpha/beta domain-containing protein n=1 Tax=Phialemonium thermophilum TaxID=223376 RepID=A0ABR3WV24_9PEZI